MTADTRDNRGLLDILDEGPCCDDMACPARHCWPYPGETRAMFVARLTAEMREEAAS